MESEKNNFLCGKLNQIPERINYCEQVLFSLDYSVYSFKIKISTF